MPLYWYLLDIYLQKNCRIQIYLFKAIFLVTDYGIDSIIT